MQSVNENYRGNGFPAKVNVGEFFRGNEFPESTYICTPCLRFVLGAQPPWFLGEPYFIAKKRLSLFLHFLLLPRVG